MNKKTKNPEDNKDLNFFDFIMKKLDNLSHIKIVLITVPIIICMVLIMNVIQSYVWWDYLSTDLLWMGTIDSALVGGITVTILAFSFKKIAELKRVIKEDKQIIQYESKLEMEVQKRTKEIEKQKEEIHQSYLILKELDSAKDNFLSIASHELRTPLTSIISFNQMMYDEVLGKINKKQKDGLKVVLESEKHLIKLISNILEISRYETGKMRMEIEVENIDDIIKHLIKEFEHSLSAVNGKIDYKFKSKTKKIMVDKIKFIEVVRNLVENSIKYRNHNKDLSLKIEITENKEYLIISIKDNGIGMEQGHLAHIFEKFYQVDQRMNRQYEGTGLGLSIVKYILDAHDAKIQINSDYGKGTEFVLRFAKFI